MAELALKSRSQFNSTTDGLRLLVGVAAGIGARRDGPYIHREDAKERKAAEDVERFQPLVGNHRSELRHGGEFIPALPADHLR